MLAPFERHPAFILVRHDHPHAIGVEALVVIFGRRVPNLRPGRELSASILDLETHVEIRVANTAMRRTVVQYTENLSSGVWVNLEPQAVVDGQLVFRFDKIPNAAFFRVATLP